MSRIIDLVGQKFGRLTVLEEAGRSNRGSVRWLCECDCEEKTRKVILGRSLRSGVTKSCGCLKVERLTTHGLRYHELHAVWNRIIQRTENPNGPHFHDYGGRGITVCEEWRSSFLSFFNYIMENLGERPPGMSIDRINNDGNYEPGNVRWATQFQQIHNRRSPSRYKASMVIEAMNGAAVTSMAA